jgi:hypothetical protein
MPEMNITSPYIHSRVDSNTFTMGNPMPKSTLTLCQSRLYPPVRDFGFGFWTHRQVHRGKTTLICCRWNRVQLYSLGYLPFLSPVW